MSLPKHLRPRVRYLAIGLESWPHADIDRNTFQERMVQELRSLVGDVGTARVDATVLRFEFEDGRGEAVVRVRRDAVTTARAALACVDEIEGQPVGVVVRGMSGTVRRCEEKYIGGGPERIIERNVVFENASRAAVTRDGRVDVELDDAFAGATDLDFEWT